MARKLLIVIAVESCLLIALIGFSFKKKADADHARMEAEKVRQELEIVKMQALRQKEEAERQMLRAVEFEKAMSEQVKVN